MGVYQAQKVITGRWKRAISCYLRRYIAAHWMMAVGNTKVYKVSGCMFELLTVGLHGDQIEMTQEPLEANRVDM